MVAAQSGDGAIRCLKERSFPFTFADDNLLLAWQRASDEGAWLDLQLADRTDDDIARYFALLPVSIVLPKTKRKSGTMDNNITNQRRQPNGYIHAPLWFQPFLPYPLSERKVGKRDGHGLHRIACLDFVLFLVAIGYAPAVVEKEFSTRKANEYWKNHERNPKKYPLIDRTYETAMSGPLFAHLRP